MASSRGPPPALPCRAHLAFLPGQGGLRLARPQPSPESNSATGSPTRRSPAPAGGERPYITGTSGLDHGDPTQTLPRYCPPGTPLARCSVMPRQLPEIAERCEILTSAGTGRPDEAPPGRGKALGGVPAEPFGGDSTPSTREGTRNSPSFHPATSSSSSRQLSTFLALHFAFVSFARTANEDVPRVDPKAIAEVLHGICSHGGAEILRLTAHPHHVHLLLAIPPKRLSHRAGQIRRAMDSLLLADLRQDSSSPREVHLWEWGLAGREGSPLRDELLIRRLELDPSIVRGG